MAVQPTVDPGTRAYDRRVEDVQGPQHSESGVESESASSNVESLTSSPTSPSLMPPQPGVSLRGLLRALSSLERANSAPVSREKFLQYMIKLSLLAAMPLVASFRAIMFRWTTAGQDPQFPVFGALICSELFVTLLVLATLQLRCGISEVMKLVDLGYSIAALAGTFNGMKWALETVALSNIDADLFLVLVKTSIVPTIAIDSIYRRQLTVGLIESMLVLLLLLGILLYSLPSLQCTSGGNLLGFGTCLLSTLAASMGDTTFGLAVRKREAAIARKSHNLDVGEKLRCFLVMQTGKLISLIPVLIIFEWNMLAAQGLHFLLDWRVVVGAIIPTMAKGLVGNIGISFCGAFYMNLAVTLDMLNAFVFEQVVLHGHASVEQGVTIGIITVAVMSFGILHRRLQKEKKHERKCTLKEVRAALPERRATRLGEEPINVSTQV